MWNFFLNNKLLFWATFATKEGYILTLKYIVIYRIFESIKEY